MEEEFKSQCIVRLETSRWHSGAARQRACASQTLWESLTITTEQAAARQLRLQGSVTGWGAGLAPRITPKPVLRIQQQQGWKRTPVEGLMDSRAPLWDGAGKSGRSKPHSTSAAEEELQSQNCPAMPLVAGSLTETTHCVEVTEKAECCQLYSLNDAHATTYPRTPNPLEFFPFFVYGRGGGTGTTTQKSDVNSTQPRIHTHVHDDLNMHPITRICNEAPQHIHLCESRHSPRLQHQHTHLKKKKTECTSAQFVM